MVSLPYIVVKSFKRNYFRMPEKMRIFAKIWLIIVSQYSFDSLENTKFKYNNVLKKDP
jgi:hypothetical protein